MTETLKLLIVGDAGVGKTTFIKKLIEGEFEPIYTPTIGVDSGIIFESFVISDFSGQTKSEMVSDEYRGGNYAIVMCDFTSRKTLENVSFWISRIKDMCGGIPIILCANKYDLPFHQFTYEDVVTSYNILSEEHSNLIGYVVFSVKFSGLYNLLSYFFIENIPKLNSMFTIQHRLE